MSTTGAERALRLASEAGVDLCLANPGTTEMGLVAALDAVPGVRAVLCLFEGVATGAADGYGRMRGRPAMTLLHLGPGFANGIANLHNARRARTPIVNVIGDQASWHLAYDAPLTSDIESLARPVSGWVGTSRSAATLPADLATAIAQAGGPRGRVASLIVPSDHQTDRLAGPAPPTAVDARGPAEFGHAAVDAAARCLRAGPGRATLLLGGDALGDLGLAAAARIASATGCRLMAETFAARWERGGSRPAPERLPYLPEQANQALEGERALVLAGAADPVAFFGYPGTPSRIAGAVARTRLADPDEDASGALVALADALDAPAHGELPEALRGAPPPAPSALPSGPLSVGVLGQVLAAWIPENAIVVDEAATSGLALYAYSAGGPPHSLLALTGGAIGQGLPCATGAALACPDRKVIAFQADGSGMYTLQALWTQARESLDVVNIICSNRAYRILHMELGRAGVFEPGPKASALTSLANPELDWCALARGMGVPGVRVDSAEALSEALGRAIATPGPRLIEVML